MKLQDWLTETNTSKADLARKVSVSAEAVRFWCIGRSIPRQAALRAIMAVTGGKVTAADFYHTEAP